MTRKIDPNYFKGFEEGNFKNLLQAIFTNLDTKEAPPLDLSFEKQGLDYKRYGKINIQADATSQVTKQADVLIVYLDKSKDLSRSSIVLNDFCKRYLQTTYLSHLLVAFVAGKDKEASGADWRFSYIKHLYTIDESKVRSKVRETTSPITRYSFLMGKDEPTHTANDRFAELAGIANPTIHNLEEAFAVEPVTKEFFEQYKELYHKLTAGISKALAEKEALTTHFIEKNINTNDFAKRLLGQIVFLYFLQKKGWLGVKHNEPYGAGDKNFLENIFQEVQGTAVNYFRNILQPLFYKALATARSSDMFDFLVPGLGEYRIPFLNGGLFEADYDWENEDYDLNLPNHLFGTANKDGSGVLDIFNKYNFTVKEDDSIDHEVAIDPEMLGKVFESLLEQPDRKKTGTYYTPRRVVHYMCQESLIAYLWRCLSAVLERKAIEDFIHDEPNDAIQKHAVAVDEALENIRVCDPAVGSGAFAVGMLIEIVQARAKLDLPKKDRSSFDLKYNAIQHNIYGVDLAAGAVDIAKLRLWLSLVVDEPSIGKVKPLPNLDYKIRKGDALLRLEGFAGRNRSKLQELMDLYFKASDADLKKRLKAEIEALLQDAMQTSKDYQGVGDFDFHLFFPEVMAPEDRVGGFDVVIANPPYIQLQKDRGVLGRKYKKMQGFSYLCRIRRYLSIIL